VTFIAPNYTDFAKKANRAEGDVGTLIDALLDFGTSRYTAPTMFDGQAIDVKTIEYPDSELSIMTVDVTETNPQEPADMVFTSGPAISG